MFGGCRFCTVGAKGRAVHLQRHTCTPLYQLSLWISFYLLC